VLYELHRVRASRLLRLFLLKIEKVVWGLFIDCCPAFDKLILLADISNGRSFLFYYK
jgi:hypothetical protein